LVFLLWFVGSKSFAALQDRGDRIESSVSAWQAAGSSSQAPSAPAELATFHAHAAVVLFAVAAYEPVGNRLRPIVGPAPTQQPVAAVQKARDVGIGPGHGG
jgi:hypothetical protein